MHKIREILRLKWQSELSDREIATSCAVSHSTVSTYVNRARLAGLSWSSVETMDDEILSSKVLVSKRPTSVPCEHIPDWTKIHRELKRKGVTRQLLWAEYRQRFPEGLQYSQFCQRYRDWCKTQSPVMRQHHFAGDKLFVDYAGMTMPVIDRTTGELYEAQIFVATLSASNYVCLTAG